ncbi:MAG: glycosyltransferase, partial [Kiritimatiellia bacterium]
LELSKSLARLGFAVDIYTRRFEKQPAVEKVAERVRIIRIPCGGRDFIPKEVLWEAIPEWVNNAEKYIARHRLHYQFINSHYWDAGLAGQSLANRYAIPHIHTPHSLGVWKQTNMSGDDGDLEQQYNFRRRIREEKIIYDECDLLIATTPLQRKYLMASAYDVATEKIHVIPPGYDDTRFFPVATGQREAIKRELGLPGRIV